MIMIFTWMSAFNVSAQPRNATGTRSTTGSGSSIYNSSLRQYNNNSMLGQAIITSDPETRRIIVVTDEETNEQIGNVITNLDSPKPQVLIKVVFLEVTHNNDLDFGVEGTYVQSMRGSDEGTAQTAFNLAAQTEGGFYKFISDDVQVTLRALAKAGKLEVLSRPSILTRNNQEAVITIGQEVPFVTNTRTTEAGNTINTIEYEDIGIILRVTPFITQDNKVEMIIAPEISTLTDQTVDISDTLSAPVIAKRSAETVVVTMNGKTVIIGGLMENQKTESVSKVPLLGDIPVLGHLFKRTIKEDSKTELMIFLTPHIIYKPSDLADLTENEKNMALLSKKTFSNEEINRYIDESDEDAKTNQGEGGNMSTPVRTKGGMLR